MELKSFKKTLNGAWLLFSLPTDKFYTCKIQGTVPTNYIKKSRISNPFFLKNWGGQIQTKVIYKTEFNLKLKAKRVVLKFCEIFTVDLSYVGQRVLNCLVLSV